MDEHRLRNLLSVVNTISRCPIPGRQLSKLSQLPKPGGYSAGSEAAGYKEVRSREGSVARVPETCVVTARPPHVQIRRPLLTLRLYLHTFPIVTVGTGCAITFLLKNVRTEEESLRAKS